MTTLQELRTEFANRRNIRQNRRELERQLATYDTPAARLEIEAIVARHDPQETRHIREILHRQAAGRLVRTGR
ncbi:MAG TPA: hypothetical protein VE441_05765 [Mycobacterium sp.]|nr:hypothetical protein [Mycobacterium sp.]